MEISEKTSVKLPLPLFITVVLGLLSVGAVYFQSKLTTEKANNNEIVIEKNEVIDRLEREKIKKESREEREKLEARMLNWLREEVGGLRSDWERRNSDVEKRLDRLEN